MEPGAATSRPIIGAVHPGPSGERSIAEGRYRAEGSQSMTTQRDLDTAGRSRGPPSPGDESRGSVSMLDTMQLTAIMTDPTPKSARPNMAGPTSCSVSFDPMGSSNEDVGWLTGRRSPGTWSASASQHARTFPSRSWDLVLGSLVLLTGGLVAGTMMASTGATPTNTSHAGLGAVAHRLVMNPSNSDLARARTVAHPGGTPGRTGESRRRPTRSSGTPPTGHCRIGRAFPTVTSRPSPTSAST